MTEFSGRAALLFSVALLAPLPVLAAPAADLSGMWSPPFVIHPTGVPMVAGVTPWMGASQGDPRRQHIPTMDEVSAGVSKVMAAMMAAHGDPARGPRFPSVPQGLLTDAGKAAFAKFDAKEYERQDLSCYPFNVFLRLGGGLGGLMIVQSKVALMMATEINGNNYPRIVWLDGRSDANALPSWEGYSIGKFHGDTLHVVTTHIKGDWFNTAWPRSPDATLTEDYRVVGAGAKRKLEILQRIDDPLMYREPLVRVAYDDWRPDEEVHDFPCEEGLADQVEINTHPAPIKP